MPTAQPSSASANSRPDPADDHQAHADARAEVSALLDALHAAAARADGQAYFALYAPSAVFLGTDAGERWTLDQFKAYAEPHFAKGTGWTYTLRPGTRHIDVDLARHAVQPGTPRVAVFDELLDNAKYGTSRGTGVAVRTADGWKILQYSLSFPIPNDLSPQITATIKAFEASAPGDAPPAR